jgi:hypothetical protein
MLRNKYLYFHWIFIFLVSISCNEIIELTPEKKVLKKLYNIACYEFRLDTLNSFESLKSFTKYEFKKHSDSCTYVGYLYNLYDSSFVPSCNKSLNCVIPCGQPGPIILKWVPINDFYINYLKDDSLTIEYTTREPPKRIHIGELKQYFNSHLNKIFGNQNLKGVKPILINVEISNNPHKELFMKVFNILFWNCYSKYFNILKHDPTIDLIKIGERPNADYLELFEYGMPFWIMFSDSTVSNKRFPILVNL